MGINILRVGGLAFNLPLPSCKQGIVGRPYIQGLSFLLASLPSCSIYVVDLPPIPKSLLSPDNFSCWNLLTVILGHKKTLKKPKIDILFLDRIT